MGKVLKELALLAGATAVGLVLLISTKSYVAWTGFGVGGYGYPLYWYTYADDYLAYMGGGIYWNNFILDLEFWVVLCVAIAEGSSHIALPYVKRKLVVRRTKRSVITASTTNVIPVPAVTA